ncbi:hypothetical protein GOBAR_AA02549 [Gossypium barbadense]|uniref:RIN4 pathogenic type III effector avirulence factor Avr cleavage site domain-containing protein n=1 Tax=Gossypium barbadense TaxID=3634 RepID=A0A2P5YR02_GOSBA|nr:hypothetical protein GOBAR_AA02549 [Gossypium barbadense]
MKEKGKALPKFGEWDLKDPATADGFTVIFNKARNEKKTRATAPPPPSIVPQKVDTVNKPPPSPPKRIQVTGACQQSVGWQTEEGLDSQVGLWSSG